MPKLWRTTIVIWTDLNPVEPAYPGAPTGSLLLDLADILANEPGGYYESDDTQPVELADAPDDVRAHYEAEAETGE